MASIFVRRHGWERLGHGGRTIEFNYTVYAGSVEIRTFSTNGNMETGYYGAKAQGYADHLAKALGDAFNAPVIHVRTGACQRTWQGRN